METSYQEQPGWSGRTFQCPTAESARAVVSAVVRERPRNATAAEPALRAAVAAGGCRLLTNEAAAAAREADLADGEMNWTTGVEFQEDGQSLQLITITRPDGKPIAWLYAQGAC
jgi:hypothetical protein